MPIMWGLAIGAAMGGGISLLKGNKIDDVLKNAAIGGAMGAAGGAFAPAAGGLGGATAEGAGSVAGSTALVDGGTAAQAFPVTGVNSGISSLPSSASWASPTLAAPTSVAPSVAPSVAQTTAPTGGFFDSGIGKTIADNKLPLGLGALGLMAFKPQSNNSNQQQDSYIRPQTYDQATQTYTAQTPIKSSDFGTRSVAEGGIIGMADGGMTTEERRENKTNPTLEALAEIQQAQQTYQPPVSQGIAQPLIQPQMAQIQQRYAAPQRQAPEEFQYQAPSFSKYSNQAAAANPVVADTSIANPVANPVANSVANQAANSATRAPVYDYANTTATRVENPTSGSPEFNIPSNYPVDPSSGMAEVQQRYANMGYTDYLPNPHNVDGSGANGGLMPEALRYAMGGGIGGYYASPDDGNRNFDGISGLNQGPQYPMQGVAHSDGGVMNYAMGGQLGGYSDGGQLLKGPGDGVSDDIPAQIGNHQPARLADGEFVVPARIVSELGNGSTDAGAKRLYAMMDRIQKNRGKTVGKGKVAVNSNSDKYLPA